MLECYPDLMTVKHVQSALSIGRSKAYQIIHNGGLHYLKLRGQIRVPKESLLDYLSSQEYNTPREIMQASLEGVCYERKPATKE